MAMFIVECCNRLLSYNHTWYRVDMVSVKLASFYQSRPSMNIRCRILQNWPWVLQLTRLIFYILSVVSETLSIKHVKL